MITCGNQIRAARALIGWKRVDLAGRARLHPNAVAYWERAQQIPPPLRSGRPNSEPVGCRNIRQAFEAAGVRFTDIPAPGVSIVP